MVETGDGTGVDLCTSRIFKITGYFLANSEDD